MSRHLPPLRLFGVFETVCRTDNLRAAAAALNVSQPAISQSLRQLEDHIGARLIDRNTRPASLTAEGEILLRATEDGLGRISGAVDEIRRHQAQRGSNVTVACSVGVATLWLMPHLESFYCDHPDVQVNVITSESGAPTITGDVDIAIRFGDGNWSDGTVTPLLEERIEPVCTPELAERLGLDRPSHPVQLRFSNYVQATQAALAGRGVALGWRTITGGYVAEGRLVVPVEAPLTPPSSFYAVTAFDRAEDAATDSLLNWLSSLGGGPSDIRHPGQRAGT